jgi:peptidoglycan/xylan/chitin deacetylase (PgdA/CDA1 family)
VFALALFTLTWLGLGWFSLLGEVAALEPGKVLGEPVRANRRAPVASVRHFAPSSGSAEICVSAGENGPCFSLRDLERYVPPPTKPKKWDIRPPIWKEYPAVLNQVPLQTRTYSTETVRYLAEHEVRYGDPKVPYMALTFDCEAGTGSTRQILETLRAENVKATFFVLGKYAYLHPEIMQELVADGHEIGNHSFFHPLFTDISPISATLEITYTEAVLAWAVGEYVPMRYVRFPYGGRNLTTRMHAAAFGYQSSFWDIDPRGWDPEKSVEDVVAHVRKTAHYGGIVIMHCSSWDDVRALPEVLQVIRDKGMTPGTLTDVLTEADRNVPGYALLPQ